jgi:hypothetical protein
LNVDDAGKAHEGVERKHAFHRCRIIGEAMKNAAHPVGEWGELGESVVQGIALMNDAI